MKVEIMPSSANGTIDAPPSKSVAHRLLICAALAEGTSIIENTGANDDILATASCLEGLGAEINISDGTATVKGASFGAKKEKLSFDCNESGSTLRFLIPVSLLFANECVFSGKGRLMERPQSVYKDLFEQKGCYLEFKNKMLYTGGELKSGVFEVAGDVSSQFLTGLMLALPLLEGDSKIILTKKLQSAPYVDITVNALKQFGIEIKKITEGYFIKGSQKYKSCNIINEGDWSNAAFLDAFNLADGNVQLTGLDSDSFQGDKIYKDFYKALSDGTPEIDISQYPDLGPVLMVCAVLKNGATVKGTKRLRIKESDRAAVMARELKKFGVNVEVGDDYIVIPKVTPHKPICDVDCCNDHRIAMAFAVLCSVTGGVLDGAQCVNKSYPDFFKDVKNLGIQYKII
ncbi:MAG: 3-phosphoshikimate 1-carboxyvinyltransferase [Clostridia bacterium]|nr:3-phosphoshikimate 1-carboxyvinyltransferase [Clostridia bacterium]